MTWLRTAWSDHPGRLLFGGALAVLGIVAVTAIVLSNVLHLPGLPPNATTATRTGAP